MDMFSLKGRVAVVSGAGRGIGRATALTFAKAGASIVAVARSAQAIEETATMVRDAGGKAISVPTDVTNVDQIKNMTRKTLEKFGKVDILVNNAGGDTGGSGYVLDLTPDQWRAGIELNLNSLFYMSKYVGEPMVKQRSGNIINVSSGMGMGPFPGAAHHAAPRAGVINFTQTLALEWAPFNIRVNCLSPGYTETPLPGKDWKEHPEHKVELLKNVPLGRVAQPEEMASVMLFLASDAASYITGQNIYVCGGLISTVPPSYYEYMQQFKSLK